MESRPGAIKQLKQLVFMTTGNNDHIRKYIHKHYPVCCYNVVQLNRISLLQDRMEFIWENIYA